MLGEVRFSDIVPVDEEAEAHAREHLKAEGEEMVLNEELKDKRDVEGLEDLLKGMSAGGSGDHSVNGKEKRPGPRDVEEAKERLGRVCQMLGLLIELP